MHRFVLCAALGLAGCTLEGPELTEWSGSDGGNTSTTCPNRVAVDEGDCIPGTPGDAPTPDASSRPDALADDAGGSFPDDDAGAAAEDAGSNAEVDAGGGVIEPEPEATVTGSVYADELAAGWNLNGWGWSSTAQEITSPAVGQRAVRIDYQRAWSGFVLARIAGGQPDFFAQGAHEALEFSLNPGTNLAQASTLVVRLNNGNPDVRVSDYLTAPLQANQFTRVRIPFAALNPSGAAYHRLEWFNASTELYSVTLDSVVLVPSTTVVPQPEEPVTTPTATSVSITPVVSVGQNAQSFRWIDADGRPRTADFVNDQYRGGYIRRFTYQTEQGELRSAEGGIDQSTGYQGFGYLVSHYDSGYNGGTPSADSRDGDYSATLKNNGASSLLWQGRNHAIRRYTVELHPAFYKASGRGTVYATVHWLVASGRSSMVFAVTYDSSAQPMGSIVADSRAPYGAVAWDGNGGREVVSGVSWGDKRRFVSDTSNTQGRLTMASNWDYTAANTVPFASAWSDGTDAEMGLVGTQSYATSVSGADQGVWFDAEGRIRGSERISARCWNRTSLTATQCADPGTDGAAARMPVSWAWPYQLMNYGLGMQGSTTKKIAWGTNYGAIGQGSVVSFGTGERIYSGYPYTSYATQVVLGKHSTGSVDRAVESQRVAFETQVTAQVGQVRTAGSLGVERNDTGTFDTAGFDPTYGTFSLLADASGRADFTLNSGAGTLEHPLIVVDGAHGEVHRLELDGVLLTDNVDYYASVQGTRVWITLNRNLSGSHALSVRTH